MGGRGNAGGKEPVPSSLLAEKVTGAVLWPLALAADAETENAALDVLGN